MKTAYFNRFAIEMTLDQALGVSHQDQCDDDISALAKVPEIAAQLDALNPDDIRAELRETGGWDAEELTDDAANRERILWVAGCNIKDEES